MGKVPYSFRYQILSELPVDNLKLVYIPNGGSCVGRDGVIVKLLPYDGESWVGIFAFGDMLSNGSCNAYFGPGRNHLTVLAKGEAYIVLPSDPCSFIRVKSCPAICAIPVPSHDLMLFHDYTEIVAYNENGLVWETKRISWDGIKIEEISDSAILGKSWDSLNGKNVQFSVDLTDGSHQGGASPPDYPTS